MLYAHWEGYFVHAANLYLNYVTEKNELIAHLRDEFWALTIRKRYRPQQVSGDVQFNRFLLDIKSLADKTFKKGTFERVNGSSNLKSDTLKHVCSCIGLDASQFEGYFDFIDKELIDKRNHIAHGASLRFEFNSLPEFRDKVVDLMRITQTQVENAATLGHYKK